VKLDSGLRIRLNKIVYTMGSSIFKNESVLAVDLKNDEKNLKNLRDRRECVSELTVDTEEKLASSNASNASNLTSEEEALLEAFW